MIVWLASFPRSGNTFLRIVLHRMFGVPTYSIYDDNDPVAQQVGVDLVGYRPKLPDRALMIGSDEVFFTKTHKRAKADEFPAIYLVRDGRDAVVSLAHQNRSRDYVPTHDETRDFQAHLRKAIVRPFDATKPSSGTWGGNVLSWLTADRERVALIRYERLIADPVSSVYQLVEELGLNLKPLNSPVIPTFEELHRINGTFFREGVIGGYRDAMSADLHDLFWQQPENAEAMRRLEYSD
jgi:hypothetical protein